MKTATKKPNVKLSGTDGNVFSLLAKCASVLKKSEAEEMKKAVLASNSYEEAIQIMGQYCNLK